MSEQFPPSTPPFNVLYIVTDFIDVCFVNVFSQLNFIKFKNADVPRDKCRLKICGYADNTPVDHISKTCVTFDLSSHSH